MDNLLIFPVTAWTTRFKESDQSDIVTCYITRVGMPDPEDEHDDIDVYIVFKSGVVMYNEYTGNFLEAMNTPDGWVTSGYGESHVRDIFEFIGYFPAPCKEQI